MSAPLRGVLVLDFTQMFAGPAATLFLAEQGARVIKVESPTGDMTRQLYASPTLRGESPPLLALNRGKESVVIDLKDKKGAGLARTLAKQADVLVDSFRPGVAERLGLDYASLSSLIPRLICASLSAFGSRGPYARMSGYDLAVQALSGTMSCTTTAQGQPVVPRILVADGAAPLALAFGIMLALFERERTGRGQQVETSLLGTLLATQTARFLQVGDRPASTHRSDQAISWPYLCQDGKYVLFVAMTSEQWKGLCRALELEALGDDPALNTHARRLAHNADLFRAFSERFRTRPAADWLARLRANDVPCAPVQDLGDALHDPHMEANEFIVDQTHPRLGPIRFVRGPVRLGGLAPAALGPAPRLGEHTDAVLREMGVSESLVRQLREEGVVR